MTIELAERTTAAGGRPTHEPLNAVHVVRTLEADSGGPARSVSGLCDALWSAGSEVSLVTRIPSPGTTSVDLKQAVDVRKADMVAPGGGFRELLLGGDFSRSFRGAAGRRAAEETIVHVHGMWLPCTHAASTIARRAGLTRIVSPRGTLSSWALNYRRWKKQIAWHVFQRRDLTTATAFHATSEEEVEDLRKLGMRQPIIMAPNGVSLPEEMPPKVHSGPRRRAMFLSRIHPKKGLPNLLHAWKQVVADDWELVVYGPEKIGHGDEIRALAKELGLTDRVSLPGELNDSDKWKAYRDADLFVLPTHSENFGIVVAEALAAGLPVLTTTGAPWGAVAEHGLGWWVEPTVEAIAPALQEATQSPREVLDETGARGATWLTERSGFGWEGVGRSMLDAYRWLLGRGDRPDCIRLA